MARPLSNSRRKAMHAVIARRYGLAGPLRFKSPPNRLPEVATPVATPDAIAALRRNPRMSGPSTADISQAELLTLRAPLAVRALNHLTFGVTPCWSRNSTRWAPTTPHDSPAFVDQQLFNSAAIDDSALDTRLANAGYTTLGKSLDQLWADHVAPDPVEIRMRPAAEVQRAALVRAVHSKRQLQEVMVGFWHNHFNVTINDFSAGPVSVHYNRDVMRGNALGNFRTMLEAVAQSTSMMYSSTMLRTRARAPTRTSGARTAGTAYAGRRKLSRLRRSAPGPALPRRPYPIGYTDVDVYETASAFTGWSVKDGHWQYPTEDDGTFVYVVRRGTIPARNSSSASSSIPNNRR